MPAFNLDLLRQQAEKAREQGRLVPIDPLIVLHLLDTIATLMDEDSILAQGQRIAKKAIDDMVKARKERDEERSKREALEEEFAKYRSSKS